MSRKFIPSVLLAAAFMMLLVSSLPAVQADSSTQALNSYEKNSGDPYIRDGKYVGDPRFGQYDPYDPTYFHSLRWLVYLLIISLPIAPTEPPSLPDRVSAPIPQQMPPPAAAAEKN
jgi:hypothetical protein